MQEAAVAHDMTGPPVGSSPGEDADAGRADQPPGVVGATLPVAAPPEAAPESSLPARQPRKPRKLLYATLPGSWGALIAGCLSFTPSLLPRGGIVQGLIWGITAAIG